MSRSNTRAISWLFRVSRVLVVGAVAVVPAMLEGQSQGNNAVYSGTSSVTGSAAYIDASAFASSSTTICATLYSILNTGYPTPGALIDARGLNSSNSNLTCAANTSPWYNGTTYLNKPAKILLPAGKIVIAYPWVVPDYTKIAGVGSSATSGAAGTTTIQAGNGTGGQPTFSGTAMIQMGGMVGSVGCPVCFEISMTDVTLDAQGQTIDGVDNSNAEELSYLQRVAILNTEGNGLFLDQLSGSAQWDSKPLRTLPGFVNHRG